MKIEVIYDEQLDIYTIKADGEVIFDCLSLDEVRNTTIGDIEAYMQ